MQKCSEHIYSIDWRTNSNTHTHTRTLSASHIATNHPGNWLLQRLCSHPIKGCQIDFDNNFQLKPRMKLLLEVTHVHLSLPRWDYAACGCVRSSASVFCVWMQGKVSHSGHASPLWLYSPCFISFHVKRKGTSVKIRTTRCGTNRLRGSRVWRLKLCSYHLTTPELNSKTSLNLIGHIVISFFLPINLAGYRCLIWSKAAKLQVWVEAFTH